MTCWKKIKNWKHEPEPAKAARDRMERAKLESAESKGGRKEKGHMTKSTVSLTIPSILL